MPCGWRRFRTASASRPIATRSSLRKRSIACSRVIIGAFSILLRDWRLVLRGERVAAETRQLVEGLKAVELAAAQFKADVVAEVFFRESTRDAALAIFVFDYLGQMVATELVRGASQLFEVLQRQARVSGPSGE